MKNRKINDKLNNLLDELRSYDTEREWFEFKENWFDHTQLGQYISALSNSAAIEGKKNAYFIWGIHDATHVVTGTTFNSNMDIKKEPLKHFLARKIHPDLNFTFEEITYEGKNIVVLTIPAARTVPTSFDNERFIRIGSSKESLRKYPEKESHLFDVLRHGFPTIENTPSKYQELTFEKLMIYYGAKNINLNPNTFKKNLNLSLFENNAFREAIINAFVHNKWVTENEPMITVFSDKIEILSRGVLAPEQTIDGFFRGESIPVNKKLSEIFLQLHISEKTGRGVPKITSIYGKDVYEFHDNSIVVKIPFKRINEVGDKVGDKVGDISELNKTQIKVLSEIIDNPNITKPELEKLVGVGKTTIDNAISILKERNIIKRVGSNKRGYWEVLIEIRKKN